MGYPTKIQLISRQKGRQWYVNADSGQVGHAFRLKSDTQSGQVGHLRSEATLAA